MTSLFLEDYFARDQDSLTIRIVGPDACADVTLGGALLGRLVTRWRSQYCETGLVEIPLSRPSEERGLEPVG